MLATQAVLAPRLYGGADSSKLTVVIWWNRGGSKSLILGAVLLGFTGFLKKRIFYKSNFLILSKEIKLK